MNLAEMRLCEKKKYWIQIMDAARNKQNNLALIHFDLPDACIYFSSYSINKLQVWRLFLTTNLNKQFGSLCFDI
jgi:hypothetical protein